jgi:HlyD family secretion protein
VLARVEAAEAALQRTRAEETRAREDSELAQRELQRTDHLAARGVVSAQELDQARSADATASAEFDAAKHNVEAASSEVQLARAGLIGADSGQNETPFVALRSPVAGRVLRVSEESERVLQAGAPVLTVGDADRLEIITDVLSTDAVKIPQGAKVFIDGWGGDRTLLGRVRRIEPAGFTKVSALGVEEQRVNVISDFVDAPERLGDGYRVQTRILIWSADSALLVPPSATFRQNGVWTVFVIQAGRAVRRNIEIGNRTDTAVEVTRGLAEGETVILHPPSELSDGMRVRTAED